MKIFLNNMVSVNFKLILIIFNFLINKYLCWCLINIIDLGDVN